MLDKNNNTVIDMHNYTIWPANLAED